MKSPKIKRRSRKKHLLRKRKMRKKKLTLKDQRRRSKKKSQLLKKKQRKLKLGSSLRVLQIWLDSLNSLLELSHSLVNTLQKSFGRSLMMLRISMASLSKKQSSLAARTLIQVSVSMLDPMTAIVLLLIYLTRSSLTIMATRRRTSM
jgi:hypothetical protein